MDSKHLPRIFVYAGAAALAFAITAPARAQVAGGQVPYADQDGADGYAQDDVDDQDAYAEDGYDTQAPADEQQAYALEGDGYGQQVYEDAPVYTDPYYYAPTYGYSPGGLRIVIGGGGHGYRNYGYPHRRYAYRGRGYSNYGNHGNYGGHTYAYGGGQRSYGGRTYSYNRGSSITGDHGSRGQWNGGRSQGRGDHRSLPERLHDKIRRALPF